MCLLWQHWTKALVLFDDEDSVSQLCCCWSMAVSIWVAFITVGVFWCATARMSELELEQWTNIKFLVKLGKSGNEIRQMLVHIYRDNAMKKTAVYRWVKRFSETRESVTDEERSGWSATSRTGENIAKIRQIVCENQLTVRSIAEQANINRETIRKILTEDLDMRKVCAKMLSFPRGVLWRWPQLYSAMRYVALLPWWVCELCCPTMYYEHCSYIP